MSKVALGAIVILALLAGCSQAPAPTTTTSEPAPILEAPSFAVVQATGAMNFSQSVVTPAVGLALDLYEPLIDVSSTGVIYVAAHVAGAVSTATPAFVSTDGGATWKQLPFAGPASAPSPAQGSGAPSGDEGHIVAAADGHAYMADVALHSFPIEGWCGDGATECYHNPNAYDRVAAETTACGGDAATSAGSLNDRPWAAYANGTLLVSNNAGTGAVQLGVLAVPPPLPTGGPIQWNMCASGGFTGGIPGVPAMRQDLTFIQPQLGGNKMVIIRGDAHDISKTTATPTFSIRNDASAKFGGGADFPVSTADHAGNYYVTALNNTKTDGQLAIGFSHDGGANFTVTTFRTSGLVGFVYLDGSVNGTGALISWVQDNATAGASDAYAAHLVPRGDQLAMQDATVVAKGVVGPCGDVMGSALGPDGRAYLALMASPGVSGNLLGCSTDVPGSHPLSVWIQGKGSATLDG